MDSAKGVTFPLALAIAIACSVLVADCRSLSAQILIPGVPGRNSDNDPADGLSGNVFLPADRDILRKMARARALLEADRHGEAMGLLGNILRDAQDGGCEDYFFRPDKNSTRQPSLKSEAHRLIGNMPRGARDLYELQYGTEARQTLDSAIAAGDETLLAKVSRCYFHTRAGGEATLLLGLHNIDHAYPLSGALLLQRLHDNHHGARRFEPTLSLSLATGWLQASVPEATRQTLSALKRSHPKAKVTIAGEQVPLFKVDVEATDWLVNLIGPQSTVSRHLDAWKMFRGNAARNATTVSGAPLLNLRWYIPLSGEPMVEDMLRQLQRVNAERGIATLSGLHPLAVTDVVLMRTWDTLMALDFKTGKRLWHVPVDNPVPKPTGNASTDQRAKAAIAGHLGRRMWDDSIYGKLSSDGSRVFSVEGLSPKPISSSQTRIILGGGMIRNSPGVSTPHNLLKAHDISSGELQWHLGGPKTEDQYELDLAGTFFLGPPLPLLGRLYVLGEIKGVIHLLALDAKTGVVPKVGADGKTRNAPHWKQQLSVVERDIRIDSQRRLAGAMPSYADGILVCPISNGAVVAMDLAAQSLLWGYRYSKKDPYRRYTMPNLRLAQLSGTGGTSSWVDFTATISAGRVLITPVGSNSLHCLDLVDGTLKWKVDRGEDLYVACVNDGNVVLVGRREVRALRLSDGKPAWDGRTVKLPEGGTPSGRGFSSEKRYFVPLSSAEVAVVDLRKGKLQSVAKSRKGNIPGNMICYRGCVISQGSSGLSCFLQLDVAGKQVKETLAANPNDAAALALQGEIFLDRSENEKGIASLFRSLELDEIPRTKDTLRDALLEGLKEDFASKRKYSERLDKLLDTPQQKATYLRLMAVGLRKSKEWKPALQRYLELVDLDKSLRQGKDWGLEPINKSYSIRRDRWVQVQLAAMRDELPEGDLADLDSAVATRRQAISEPRDKKLVRQFLDYFDGQPDSDEVRRRLVSLLDEGNEKLAAELLSGRHHDAKRVTDKKIVWPPKVVDSKQTVKKSVSSNQKWALAYRGNPEPFFSDDAFRFNRSRSTIVCVDSLGKDRWSLPVPRTSSLNYYPYMSQGSGVRVNGHLIVLKMGSQVMAIDTLAKKEGGSDAAKITPRLLWQEDLTKLDTSSNIAAGILQQAIRMPFGGRVSYTVAMSGGLGPVTDSYTCFQRYRNLVAVDTLSGKQLWLRSDVPTGCTLFGDEELIFVLPPGKTDAAVYRALDGTLLGTRPMRLFNSVTISKPVAKNDKKDDAKEKQPAGKPRSPVIGSRLPFRSTCKATIGRNVLSWYRSEDGKHYTLELFDPWDQKQIWEPLQFSADAKLALIEHKVAGIVAPDGQFAMVDLSEGQIMAEHKLQPEKDISGITFFRSGDQYILMLQAKPELPKDVQITPLTGMGTIGAIVDGTLYALDMEGRLTWDKPASIKHQSILKSQPANLPVITFACRRYDRSKTSTQRNKISVVCLDKRTGREAYKGSVPYSYNSIDVTGDIENKTVELNMHKHSVILTFSDKALPPPSTSKALWKAIGKAVEKTDPKKNPESDPMSPFAPRK